MAWCYTFGARIGDGCRHPMIVVDGEARCACAECGVVCEGLFAACRTMVFAPGGRDLQLRSLPPRLVPLPEPIAPTAAEPVAHATGSGVDVVAPVETEAVATIEVTMVDEVAVVDQVEEIVAVAVVEQVEIEEQAEVEAAAIAEEEQAEVEAAALEEEERFAVPLEWEAILDPEAGQPARHAVVDVIAAQELLVRLEKDIFELTAPFEALGERIREVAQRITDLDVPECDGADPWPVEPAPEQREPEPPPSL